MNLDTLRKANALDSQIRDIQVHIRDVADFDVDNYFDADKHLGAAIYIHIQDLLVGS